MPYPRNSHPAEQGLQLPSLPRFHPANYQNSNGGPLTAPSMPRPPSSPRSPRPHHRQVSQAQQKLLQYQRELVINATRASRSIISQAPGSNPTSPKLLPLGSPGPVTPLMLGDQDDYLIAGARASRSPLGEGSPHELVDRLIDDEGEMKRYSSAHSGQNSPVVGPAGGPG
ncbi:hypothetical protein MMC20_007511 [Loxospora ochrophaea]|nr:hypothetical protein [Loxospora ochrophaea]